MPEIVDVTNTSLCRTTRSRAKIGGPQLSKSGGENVHPATTTTTMKHTALTRQASVVGTMAKTQGRDGASDKENSSEDLVSATATSKCRTRARRGRTMKQRRATGGETQDVSELDVEVDKPVTAQVTSNSQCPHHIYTKRERCAYTHMHIHIIPTHLCMFVHTYMYLLLSAGSGHRPG